MNKTAIFYILSVIVLIITFSFLDSVFYGPNKAANVSVDKFTSKIPQLIGATNNGIVVKSGPYGNPNTTAKIAIVVGVHPMEVDSHSAIIQSIINLNKSVNYSYYIYNVNVTRDRDSYNDGRMHGQILANKYVVPDINKNDYHLVVDVHSNMDDDYQEKFFLVVPIENKRSMDIANRIIPDVPGIVYYKPPGDAGPSSPAYVTIPLINSGTPAIVYEVNRTDPYEITLKHAVDLVNALEKLKLSS